MILAFSSFPISPTSRTDAERKIEKAPLLRARLLTLLTTNGQRRTTASVHIPHAAAAMAAGARRSFLLFRNLRDQGFGGEHEAGNRSGILQRGADDLRRVEHAGLDQILVLVGERVVAEVRLLGVEHLAQHNRAFFAGVLGDHAQRLGDGALHDVDADLLVAFGLDLLQARSATGQRHAAAGDDSLFHGCAGRVHRIFHAGFLFLHFGFGRSADFDHGYATDQLRQPLLQLLAVIVAGGLVDLAANFLHATFDLAVLAFAFDDGGVVLVDGDLLGLAEVGHLNVLELDAEIFGDGLAAGEDGDILQHRLAGIAEAGSLDGRDLQRATELIDDESRQRFAFHVFGDDHERLAALRDLLEQRKQVLHGADLLFVDQDVSVLEHRFHALGIGDEVGREIAAVELHALDDFELGLKCLRLFDGNDAVLADLLHGLGDNLADGLIVVSADGAYLGDVVALDGLRQLVEFARLTVAFLVELAGDDADGLLDAALQGHRVRTGRDGLDAFAVDGLRENGSGSGAVASDVRRLGGDFAHHLRAHVLESIFQFDFFCDGDAVLGDGRRTELLLNNDVAPLGAECDLHGVGQKVDAAENRLTGFFSVNDVLCH